MSGPRSMGRSLHVFGTNPIYQSKPKMGFGLEPIYKLEPKIRSETNFLWVRTNK